MVMALREGTEGEKEDRSPGDYFGADGKIFAPREIAFFFDLDIINSRRKAKSGGGGGTESAVYKDFGSVGERRGGQKAGGLDLAGTKVGTIAFGKENDSYRQRRD